MNVGNIKFESEIKRKVRKDFFEIIENILRFAKTLRSDKNFYFTILSFRKNLDC